MSSQEKKWPTDIQVKQTWLGFLGNVWLPYGQARKSVKSESWFQSKTMAGGELFFPEIGNSNKHWLMMGAWSAITVHRSQPWGGVGGAPVKRVLTATAEFLCDCITMENINLLCYDYSNIDRAGFSFSVNSRGYNKSVCMTLCCKE